MSTIYIHSLFEILKFILFKDITITSKIILFTHWTQQNIWCYENIGLDLIENKKIMLILGQASLSKGLLSPAGLGKGLG